METTTSPDHDLLIELRTEMRGLRADLKELKDGLTLRVDDHERRLRWVERSIWRSGAIISTGVSTGITGLGWLIQFLIGWHH